MMHIGRQESMKAWNNIYIMAISALLYVSPSKGLDLGLGGGVPTYGIIETVWNIDSIKKSIFLFAAIYIYISGYQKFIHSLYVQYQGHFLASDNEMNF